MNKRAIVTENDKKPHFPDQVFRKAEVNTMKLLYRDHLRDRSQWSPTSFPGRLSRPTSKAREKRPGDEVEWSLKNTLRAREYVRYSKCRISFIVCF